VPAEHAITTDELSKSYGEDVAVAGVTFHVAKGEIFAYLGRNGSGKTTTVRMLTTLTRPTGGSATVAGVDIRRPRELRRLIGVTLQEAALDPAMTAIEHLNLIAGLWGMSRAEAKRQAHASLGTFGLTEHADRKIGTFSGGMQRRLDISTALLGRPRVLFLDEPTTGLDPQSRRALWTEMRRLRDDGVTIFLTTQYLEEADELADRIAIVDRGAIIAEGTAAELKAAHGQTTIAVEHTGILEQLLHSLEGAAPDIAVEASGANRADVILAPAADGTELLAVLGRLRRHGPDIRHLSVRKTSLEDVFLSLTGTSIVIDSNHATAGAN
jgi:daunorubicin resistance ABC transporter ATP-binding subunit